MVAVDDHHLQDVVFHVADNATVNHLGVGKGTLRDQLAVEALDDLDPLALIGNEEVLSKEKRTFKDIWRCRLLVLEVGLAVFSYQHTVDIGLTGHGAAQIIDNNEVGSIALL